MLNFESIITTSGLDTNERMADTQRANKLNKKVTKKIATKLDLNMKMEQRNADP